MQAFNKVFTNISSAFDINQATLSGALDVVVVKHPDGTLHASPFVVRFGRLKLLVTRD